MPGGLPPLTGGSLAEAGFLDGQSGPGCSPPHVAANPTEEDVPSAPACPPAIVVIDAPPIAGVMGGSMRPVWRGVDKFVQGIGAVGKSSCLVPCALPVHRLLGEGSRPPKSPGHPRESGEVDSRSKCNSCWEKASAGVFQSRHLRGVAL